MSSYVYVVTHLASLRHYVGKANNPRRRWVEHRSAAKSSRHSNCPKFHAALRKYGSDSFTFQVVEEWPTELEASEAEQFWVAFLRSDTEAGGFNLTSGGEGAFRHTSEARAKIAKAGKGRIRSEESRRKTADALRGHAVSAETRRKQSDARIGRTLSVETRKKISRASRGRPGRPLSQDTKDKLSAANTGRILSEETRQKISVAVRGRTVSEETRQRMSAAAKRREDARRAARIDNVLA